MAAATLATTTDYETLLKQNQLTQQNKAIVLEWCKHLNDRNYNGMLSLCDPNGTWYMQGRPDGPDFAPYADTLSIHDQIQEVQKTLTLFDTWRYTVTGVTAEGERVAIESVSEGEGPGEGKHYENTYMKQFVVRGGKIVSIREFLNYFAVMKYIKGQ